MQVEPDPENPNLLHLRKLDIEDVSVYNPSSMNIDNPSSTNCVLKPTVLTKLKQRKRAAIFQLKEPALTENLAILPAASKGKSILQKKKSQKKPPKKRTMALLS